MSNRLGYEIYLKLENLQPSQSFKYRGISLFASRAVKDYGPDVHLVAATSGNAGVALAWVCKALKIQTSVFIPTTATTVQPELEMAGARVVVGGTDYADAFLEAQRFCETTPKAVLMSSYDHPTLWEGHSTMVFELGHQLPKGTTPDAIVCNVGGGGLLGGILQGVNVLGWGHSKIIGVETHGSNCYQLSMLANSAESGLDSEFPKDVTFAKLPPLTKAIAQGVYLAKLPAITSKASSLGARCPSQTTVEMGLARRAQAMQDPAKYGGLSSVSVPDEIAMDAVLSFLDEQKLLAELACGATLSLAYTPGLLSTLVPKSLPHRPVVVFIICGGSKTAVEDLEQYCSILRKLGTSGLNASRKDILINLGVGPT